MSSLAPLLVRISFLFALLLSPAVTRAELGVIRDNGAFFSESAKSEASRHIGEIGGRFKKDLVVDTFKGIPDDIKQGVNLQDRAAVNRMFEQWTVRLARQQRVNGIYILLTKEPAHLQIVVGNETQVSLFTLKDRDALVSSMLARLRNKQNDEALQDGVNFVSATMKARAVARNARPTPAASSAPVEATSPWGWVVAALIGFVVAWIVVGLIRSMMQRSGSAATPGAAPSSGGGFLSSLLGGMLGAAAGMWLYDQFSGHNDSDHNRGSADDAGNSRSDTDYSSSGDSFSDDSSGGDAGGGGDSGGGDF
ncbi:MAG: hypothetical protein WCQ89_13110 [Verrucomicrobiota bacterium]|jgi:uncharacterized protein